MSIPKILHYCWYGNKPLSRNSLNYIEGWKKLCPDFQIICWSEENSSLSENVYVQQAYQAKQWAFVSDYMRLKALWQFGGIYLDTDVELISRLDPFLNSSSFIGFEEPYRLGSAIIGSEPEQPWINDLLSLYQSFTFPENPSSSGLVANTEIITRYLVQTAGLNLDNSKQLLAHGLVVYPCEYFSPKSFDTGLIHITKHTAAIHHFKGSWLTPGQRAKHSAFCLAQRILGNATAQQIKQVINSRQGRQKPR